jgi:hypothetical protein
MTIHPLPAVQRMESATTVPPLEDSSLDGNRKDAGCHARTQGSDSVCSHDGGPQVCGRASDSDCLAWCSVSSGFIPPSCMYHRHQLCFRIVTLCSARGQAARLRAIRDHRAARWIQNVARRKFGQNIVRERRFRLWAIEHETVFRAALLIQRMARGMVGRIRARSTLYRRQHAINIQRIWKGFQARRLFLNLFATK